VKTEFRPARSDDAAAISALIGRFTTAVVVNPDRSGAENYLAAISVSAEARYITDPRYQFIVACSGPDLAGVIALRDNNHLFHLFVAPEYQRRGIATGLWQLARVGALAAGNTGSFTVNSTLSALPVYQHFGFVQTGPVTEAHGIRFVPMRLQPASLPFRTPPGNLRNLVIEAPRVRLVAISEAYTEEIFRHFSVEITRYMMPAPPSDIAESQGFVASALIGLERGDDLQFVICRRDNDEFLGVCGLHGTRRPDEPELGIWLKAQAHGNHYGREAITALADWAGKHLEFRRLIYPVDRRNAPSRKIAEALGGRIVGAKKVMSLGGIELDEVIYAIERRGG
jgi:RimJ/RimL family protein N-acetyltransferase